MGFVTKLLTVFIPLIAVMIFYHQRDNILDRKQNELLDEQFQKLTAQFNHHLDSVVEQINQFVAESKDVINDNIDTSTDEVDLKEKIVLKKEQKKDASKEETKIDAKLVKSESDDEQISKPVERPMVKQAESQAKQTENQVPKPDVKSNKCDLGKDLLITKEQLSKYNGEDAKKKIYLAFLGIVYDVSKGEQHYAPGGAYSMFTGKDASRAFITGDFSEAGLTDDLTGLKADSFNGVKEWSDFYEKSYRRVGRLVGGFYDQNGCPTQQVRFVDEQLEKASEENLDEQYENELYPSCNTEWNQNKKETRFWCTKQSGGVQRDWIGVPRQLFSLKNKKDYRCACVRDFGPATKNAIEYADEEDVGKTEKAEQNVGDLNNPRVRKFDGCEPKATECVVKGS